MVRARVKKQLWQLPFSLHVSLHAGQKPYNYGQAVNDGETHKFSNYV